MAEPKERWGGDGLGPDDMAIPEIKLVQNVGGDVARAAGADPGDFYCSLTDETIKGDEGFDIVIVAMQKNRTFWGRSDILDMPPECASLDARSMKSINGDDCSTCEHRNEAPWLLSPDERRQMCLINYNIIAVRLPEQLPTLIRTSGLSAQSAKELYTQLALNKQLVRAWYKAITHVGSVKKKSSAGDAFAMKFGKLRLVEDKVQLEEVKLLSGQLLGTQIALPEGRDEEVTAEAPPAAPTGEKTEEAKTTQPANEGKPEKTEEVPPVVKQAEQEQAEREKAVTKPIDMDF